MSDGKLALILILAGLVPLLLVMLLGGWQGDSSMSIPCPNTGVMAGVLVDPACLHR